MRKGKQDRGSIDAADRDDARGAKAEAEAAPVDKYEHITRDQVPELYALLDELIREHHASDLAEANVALMWVYKVEEDRDGHVVLGKARKVSKKEQQFHAHDFVIELNWEAWSKHLTPPQRRALLDHELEHCGRSESENGDSTYYIRKHDIEEFRSIVARHGIWKDDIQAFVDAAMGSKQQEMFGKPRPVSEKVVATIRDLKASMPKGTSLELSVAGREPVKLEGTGPDRRTIGAGA